MARTRTTKAANPTETEAPKLTIPSAVRGTPSPAPATGTSLLSQLVGAAPATPKGRAKGGKSGLEMSEETQQLFRDHIAAKVLADHFGDHSENVKDALKAELWPMYVAQMWANKSQPENPSLKTTKNGKPDCEGQYIIQAKFKVQTRSAEETIKMLVELNVQEADARALVENEIDFSPSVAIKFNELQNGRYVEVEGSKSGRKEWQDSSPEEKAVAEKALKLLLSLPTEPLTDEEKGLLISTMPQATVKKGFLQRVAGYVRSIEQLFAVFKVITPIEMAKGAKFGISDSLTERNRRLVEEAGKILGVSIAMLDEEPPAV
jgi:hypothetical protein